MKQIFLLIMISMALGPLCHASEEMKVHHCPRIFKLALKELKLSPPEDHQEAKSLVRKLAENGRVSVRLRITFSGAGKCHYEGRNLDGSFFWGSLSPDSEQQTSADFKLKIRSNNMQLIVPVENFSTKGLLLNEEEIDLFYKAKERGSRAISIGSAIIAP
jgi:hypothetical protein